MKTPFVYLRAVVLMLMVLILGAGTAGAQDRTANEQIRLQALKTFLEQETLPELQITYDYLGKQYFEESNPKQKDFIYTQLEIAQQVLDVKTLAVLRANNVEFQAQKPLFAETLAELTNLNRQKWCHQTPARWLRGYKVPDWCKR